MNSTFFDDSNNDQLQVLFHGSDHISDMQDMLRKTEMFADFEESALNAIAKRATTYRAAPGSILLKEGEETGNFFLLIDGTVEIFKESGQGERRKITTIKPGSALGEMSMIDGMAFSATARVAESAILILLTRTDLNQLAAKDLPVYHAVFSKISKQISINLRHTTQALSRYLQRTADLTETLRQAWENSRNQSNFFATMSHDLRTPLNAIMGYSELFESELMDNNGIENVEDLKRIRVAGQHMLSLINNILDFSKMEAGKHELFLESFSIGQLVEEVAQLMQPVAMGNRNRLRAILLEEGMIVRLDQMKTRQVLVNLIGNACKFTHEGDITLTLGPDIDGHPDTLSIAVTDTGIGMSPAELRRIFQSFSQAAPQTASKYGGTGLGLFISQSFCHMMGGEIHVNSSKGKGSTFTIRLPKNGPSTPAGSQ